MRPGNDEAYESRLLTCFACAEIENAKAGLREANSAPGIRISVTKS